MRTCRRIIGAVSLIALLSAGGFCLVILAFSSVCWIVGHDDLEATVGFLASVAFGVWIGVESFLWLREWLARRNDRGVAGHKVEEATSAGPGGLT